MLTCAQPVGNIWSEQAGAASRSEAILRLHCRQDRLVRLSAQETVIANIMNALVTAATTMIVSNGIGRSSFAEATLMNVGATRLDPDQKKR